MSLDLLIKSGDASLQGGDFLGAIRHYIDAIAEASIIDDIYYSQKIVDVRYNLGEAYNSHFISQPLDALDAYNLAAVCDMATSSYNYEYADEKHTNLERIDKKRRSLRSVLDGIARNVQPLNNSILDKPEDWFRFYVNPYELLGVSSEYELLSDDGNGGLGELKIEEFQRKKKLLLQELELEDGYIQRMGGVVFDRSRSASICDELLDRRNAIFHGKIFRCKRLNNFLSRGSLAHFLYNEPQCGVQDVEYSTFVNWYMENKEFEEWLSERFALQYNFVLGRALNRQSTPVLMALFSGRRWVLPKHDEICYETAERYIKRLIEPVLQLTEIVEKGCVSTSFVEGQLNINLVNAS
jgi:hypothetical protein